MHPNQPKNNRTRRHGGAVMDKNTLVHLAVSAMQSAYAPYSGFMVGAALETADGTVYTGANIENAAYSATVCAERTAFFRAVHDGHRHFTKIAVVGGKDGVLTSFTPPCGVCRQVMREFCGDDFAVLLSDGEKIRETTLGALFPMSFGPEHLEGGAFNAHD
ncbi:MAG: cytidine deaminase [Clostridia bacterium]|nr:cytidine deaminase [Clostridia bacterium]